MDVLQYLVCLFRDVLYEFLGFGGLCQAILGREVSIDLDAVHHDNEVHVRLLCCVARRHSGHICAVCTLYPNHADRFCFVFLVG